MQQSWWITGRAQSCYFLVLFKASVHGQVKLQKMAGDLLERTGTLFFACLVLMLGVPEFR